MNNKTDLQPDAGSQEQTIKLPKILLVIIGLFGLWILISGIDGLFSGTTYLPLGGMWLPHEIEGNWAYVAALGSIGLGACIMVACLTNKLAGDNKFYLPGAFFGLLIAISAIMS